MEPIYSKRPAFGVHGVRTKGGALVTYNLTESGPLKIEYTSYMRKEDVAEFIQFLQTIHSHMKG